MNEWSFFFVQNSWLEECRIQDGWHPQVEWEWMSEDFYLFKMPESKMAEYKMPDIIKLSENEWVSVRLELVWVRVLCKMAESKIGEFMMDPSSSWVRMNEWSFFCSKWLTRRKQNSRWLTSSSWVRMNEFESDWISLSQSFVQNGWIQDGSVWIQHVRIQDGCHHQDDSGWMSEVFLCKMAESRMAEFKMAAIIMLIRLN